MRAISLKLVGLTSIIALALPVSEALAFKYK